MTTFDTPRTRVRSVPAVVGSDYLAEALAHPAMRHALLQRFAEGGFRDADAAAIAFAREYSGFVAWSAHFVRCALGRVEQPAHQAALQRRLAIEQGQLDDATCTMLRRIGVSPRGVLGVPRAALFDRFARALGLGDHEIAEPTAAASRYRTRLLQYLTQSSPAAALGAFAFGIEFANLAASKRMLRGLLGIGTLRRDALAWFELQSISADAWRRELLGIANDLATGAHGADEVLEGVRAALGFRCEFLDPLYVRTVEADRAGS
jgi:hypothetical protein